VSRGGTQVRVRQGERLDDWTLESLQDNLARFVRGGETHELPLIRNVNQSSGLGAAAFVPPDPSQPGMMPPGMPPGMPQGMPPDMPTPSPDGGIPPAMPPDAMPQEMPDQPPLRPDFAPPGAVQ